MTPLRLTAAASAADPRIDKKSLGSGTKTIIISDKEMKVSVKQLKHGFLSVLIGTLSAISLPNLLPGKGMIRAGDRMIRARQYF